MKKLFTLITVLCVTLSANAKTWDFTNWSQATLDMLNAVAATTADDAAEWRTVEKSGGNGSNGEQGCYFKVANQTYAPITVNGVEIPELKGLKFTLKTSKPAFGLIWNMQTTFDSNKWGPYNGPAYIWAQKANDTISVPGVKRGTKLKIGVESHKPTDARGFNLVVDGAVITPDSGEAKVKTYTNLSWTIPEGDGAMVEAKLVATSGCHIYYITIETDESKSKIAYLYNGTATDALKNRVAALETYDMVAIDLATADLATLSLRDYDAVVIDPAVGTAQAEFLKNAIPWQPVVNFCADLYEVWGYGTKATPSSELAVIKKDNAVLFSGLEITEEEGVKTFSVTNGEVVPAGVSLAGNFADDDVYAVDFKEAGDETPSAVLFHSHNTNHNAYYYMPYSAAGVSDVPAGTEPIFANVILAAANSKSKVGATPTPEIQVVNGKLNATITITDKVAKSAIYYTLDGSEPTTASTLYTEPFVLTSACTVKALAVGEGYENSAIASADVVMKDQAKTPVITISEPNGIGLPVMITIATDEAPAFEGDEIVLWYNYTGDVDTLKSTRYTEPIYVQTATNKTIYAFAQSETLVASIPAQETFSANSGANLRRNVLTHMDVSSTDWNGGSTSNKYYFSWGKTAQSMYNEIEDPENPGSFIKVLKTPETFQPGTDDGMGGKTYENAYSADWQVKSYGQVMNWLNASCGMDLCNGGGYNAWKVDDLDTEDLVSKFALQFGGKQDGESANASIETVKKFKGPFNVLAFVGNGSADKSVEDSRRVYRPAQTFEIAVSTDTTNAEGWVPVDSILTPTNQRNWSKYEVPYNGTDEVFVRFKQVAGGSSAYVFNIYLMGPSGSSLLLGDANDDKNVDVTDITTIASFILGNAPEPWNKDNADANQDGNIDVTDITTTAGIILGK